MDNKTWIMHSGTEIFFFNEARSELLDSSKLVRELKKTDVILLKYFLMNSNEMVSRTDLARDVWNNLEIETSTVDHAIRQLRIAFKDHENKSCLKTVRGQGFIFDAEIRQRPENNRLQANSARMLKEVVSLSAYRSRFDAQKISRVYCDVIFSEGRFSGDKNHSLVRFRLSLRKAELEITSPDVNEIALHPKVKKCQMGNSRVAVQRKSIDRSIVIFKFESINESRYLEGPVWEDAMDLPLLHGIDRRTHSSQEITELNLKISCRREDFDIHDIQIIEDSLRQDWDNSTPEKRKAVEAYLKEEMLKNALDYGNLDDGFSLFTFAESIVFEEIDV